MPAKSAATDVKPFLFETDFDALAKRATTAAANAAKESETEPEEDAFEEEIVPTFSEEEMERAKQEAFEAGKQAGADEANESIERETRDVIKAVSLRITDLFAAQERANNLLLRDGIGIATAMMRKLFPEMNRQNALGEICRLVETTLMRLIEESRVVVRVHPDLHQPMEELIPSLKAGAGYEGRLLLKDDPKLEYGDCRLEWGNGAAERNVDHLWQSIDQIIEENIEIVRQEPSPDTSLDIETGFSRDKPMEDAPVEASDDETESPQTTDATDGDIPPPDSQPD